MSEDSAIPVVELRDAGVGYPGQKGRVVQACQEVDIRIEPRQIVTVVGESGCGKSTIGKLALGVLQPTTGEVSYDGESLWGRGFRWSKEKRLRVGVVHQDSYASLNPVKTVEQILMAPLLFHGVCRGRAQGREYVRDVLTTVGLTPEEYFANKYPFQLSGGQRQRVSIARAMLLRPGAIVADEPVSAVDASLRLSILELMRDVNERLGIAFLYITHDLATARYFGRGGRLVVMYLGRVVEEGEVSAVIDHPRHPYLQALLAALPPLDPRRAHQKRPLPLKSLEMPDPSDPPPGCAFHPRCPYSESVCSQEIPELRVLGTNRPAENGAPGTCHGEVAASEATSRGGGNPDRPQEPGLVPRVRCHLAEKLRPFEFQDCPC